MKKLKLANTEIAFTRHGKGCPLVLLHGFPLDHQIWNNVIPLLENDFEIVTPDLRGFGQSQALDARYSLSDLAEDISHLLNHLGMEKAVVAGHSMGGYVALAFAKSYADKLLGLGLIATQAAADTPERKDGRYQTAAQVEKAGVDVVADSMTEKLTADKKLQKVIRDVIMGQPKSGVVSALKALAERPDQTVMLKSLGVPIAIIHGNADLLIPVTQALSMNEIVPSSKLTILAEAGHMPMLEYPRETALALRQLGEIINK